MLYSPIFGAIPPFLSNLFNLTLQWCTERDVVQNVAAAATCFFAGYAIKTLIDRGAAKDAADQRAAARRDADSVLKEARIEAKEVVIKAKDEFEKTTHERRNEQQKLEERLEARELTLERKSDTLDNRSSDLDRRDQKARADEERARQETARVEELRQKQIHELERIAGLSRDQARDQILSRLNSELETERGTLLRRFQDETRQELEREGRDIMVTAMERYAGDCAYERTTATIPLPGDEMKGRIIGREGRNIRALEAATGVSVLIDDTPEAVVITCFDPVRREIARVALERLIADGRIHPTRIEEMVEKVTKEMDADLQKCGQEVIERLRIAGVKPALVKNLGRLKYRYSFSQNVLAHSEEVAGFMGAIAAQLGLDEQKARRIGLFHDIGKAVDHEIEGSHAVIGMDLLKRHGEDDETAQAVGCHHEDIECNSLYGALAKICDKLSASRPGARSETTELYIKRLEQLEAIGLSFPGVDSCYAIQAGRELRVLVVPEKISESQAAVLARDAAQKIEKEMRYPGQIKVTVIRETRASDLAK